MLTFDFDPRATEDVRAGIRHYNRKPPRKGKEFRIALKSTIEIICRHPRIGVPHLDRIRKRTVPDFATTVFYIEFADRIWIVAVSLAGRSSEYWMDRIPRHGE